LYGEPIENHVVDKVVYHRRQPGKQRRQPPQNIRVIGRDGDAQQKENGDKNAELGVFGLFQQ
jgi:hypothetical protein